MLRYVNVVSVANEYYLFDVQCLVLTIRSVINTFWDISILKNNMNISYTTDPNTLCTENLSHPRLAHAKEQIKPQQQHQVKKRKKT